jgi:hypothetical protein
MSTDETFSKPFKNASIKLILNEDDQREQASELRRPSAATGLEALPLSPSSHDLRRSALERRLSSASSLVASPAHHPEPIARAPLPPRAPLPQVDPTDPINSNFPPNNHHHAPHNMELTYYPMHSYPEYPDNRRGRRFRRRYNQILRKYMCSFPGCTKSYGSLNYLNTHIFSKKHGQRKSKADFQSQEDTSLNGVTPNRSPSGWYMPPHVPAAGFVNHQHTLPHPMYALQDPRAMLLHEFQQKQQQQQQRLHTEQHLHHHPPHQQPPPPPPLQQHLHQPHPPLQHPSASSEHMLTQSSREITPSHLQHALPPTYYLHQPMSWVFPPGFQPPPPHPGAVQGFLRRDPRPSHASMVSHPHMPLLRPQHMSSPQPHQTLQPHPLLTTAPLPQGGAARVHGAKYTNTSRLSPSPSDASARSTPFKSE